MSASLADFRRLLGEVRQKTHEVAEQTSQLSSLLINAQKPRPGAWVPPIKDSQDRNNTLQRLPPDFVPSTSSMIPPTASQISKPVHLVDPSDVPSTASLKKGEDVKHHEDNDDSDMSWADDIPDTTQTTVTNPSSNQTTTNSSEVVSQAKSGPEHEAIQKVCRQSLTPYPFP